MTSIAGVGAFLIGLVVGAIGPTLIGLRVKVDDFDGRGYLNAIAVGILLAAALPMIPMALSEVEFTSYALISSLLPPSFGESNFIPWALQFQVVVRSLGVVAILVLYLRSNAPLLATEREQFLQEHHPLSLRSRLRLWLALPLEGQVDRVGIITTTIALLCYTLWLGASEGIIDISSGSVWLGAILFVGLATVRGGAIIGLLSQPAQHRPWLIGVPLLLGGAIFLGTLPPLTQIILTLSPLILALGAICLIYAIGRLLRILQDQIGLDWPTTVTVGLSGLVVYFGNEYISRLI